MATAGPSRANQPQPSAADYVEALSFIYDLLHYCLGSEGKEWDVIENEKFIEIQDRVKKRYPHSLSTMSMSFGNTVLELRERHQEQFNSYIQKHGREMFSSDEDFTFFLQKYCRFNFVESFLPEFLKYCVFIVTVAFHCYDSDEENFVENILWFTKPMLRKVFLKRKLTRFDAKYICHDIEGTHFHLKF